MRMVGDDDPTRGLGHLPRDEWKAPSKRDAEKQPIDLLADEALHAKVKTYLCERLDASEREMSQFYWRWQYNEQRHQAYIHLPDWEERIKQMNDSAEPPKAVRIVVPFSYAALSTICAFLLQTFTGRKPLFHVQSYKGEFAKGAAAMEQWLDYNAEHTRMIKVIWQFLYDCGLYNLGIMRCNWEVKKAVRTIFSNEVAIGPMRLPVPGANIRRRQEVTVYQGNVCENVDPFMFFPDPNVPMSEVASRGEYVFFRSYQGRHYLLKMESQGVFKYINKVGTMPQATPGSRDNLSRRTALIGTQGHAGQDTATGKLLNYCQIDEGSVEIIPRELGLGDSTVPEKWLFTIVNKKQIVRCQPLRYDHDRHPVVVSEPYGSSYSFGHAGLADLIGPLQDLMSWFVNAHISSVRQAINNRFIYDPSRIERQDIEEPVDEDVMYIRMKQAAYGTDVRTALHQLQTNDVTQNHIRDLQVLMQLANALIGIDDVLKGQSSGSSRRSATEIRTVTESASLRIGGTAKIISAQAMSPLAEMMSINTQQYVDGALWVKVLGKEGQMVWEQIQPQDFAGDFHFPVHDGTLPLDKIALLDVWKELFGVILKDQELRMRYNTGSIFEWMASLSGVKNLADFKLEVLPDSAIDAAAASGIIAPANEALGPDTGSGPAARLAGAVT